MVITHLETEIELRDSIDETEANPEAVELGRFKSLEKVNKAFKEEEKSNQSLEIFTYDEMYYSFLVSI